MKLKKVVPVLAAAVIASMAAGCSSDQNSQSANTQAQEVKMPQYSILKTEKLSHDRLNLIVQVDEQISESQAKAIAEKLIKENPKFNRIYIAFTDNPFVGNAYTLGQYEYGPGGSAAWDPSLKSKDKELKLVNNLFNKDWSQRPSKADYQFQDEFNKFVVKHPQSADKFKEFVAQKGISEEEGNKIIQRVALWQLSGKPDEKK